MDKQFKKVVGELPHMSLRETLSSTGCECLADIELKDLERLRGLSPALDTTIDAVNKLWLSDSRVGEVFLVHDALPGEDGDLSKGRMGIKFLFRTTFTSEQLAKIDESFSSSRSENRKKRLKRKGSNG